MLKSTSYYHPNQNRYHNKIKFKEEINPNNQILILKKMKGAIVNKLN